MEKSRYIKGPPDMTAYMDLDRPNETMSECMDVVGLTFGSGTAAGFCYHFIRGGGNNRLAAALSNAPRVGGAFTLFTLATGVTSAAYYMFRGDAWIPNPADATFCVATTAALLSAPRGFRSASLAALASTGLMAFFYGSHYFRTHASSNLVRNR